MTDDNTPISNDSQSDDSQSTPDLPEIDIEKSKKLVKIANSKLVNGVIEAIELGNAAKSKTFGVIAKLDAYALVAVALLRSNAPEKALEKLQTLPGIGYAAWAVKIGLRHPLNWLNEQLIIYGEPPIMKPLVEAWKEKGISSNELAIKLEKLPQIFDNTVKQDSFELLINIIL